MSGCFIDILPKWFSNLSKRRRILQQESPLLNMPLDVANDVLDKLEPIDLIKMPHSKPLAYPSLKCVIKHMEVNTRIELSHRCPSIRKAEKSTPLRIDTLELNQHRAQYYRLASVKVSNTDYSLALIIDNLSSSFAITFRKEQLPYNMQLPQAFMCLISKLFCGRRYPIQVKRLSIECEGILQLPADLSLRVSHLELLGSRVNKFADAFQPLLKGSRLQSITVNNDFNIEKPIFKTANLLILLNPNEDLFRATAASNVLVRSSCNHAVLLLRVVDLIRHWTLYGHKIGTFWNFSMVEEQLVLLSMVQLRKLPGASYKGHEKFSELGRSVIIPMDDSAEIHAFCKKDPSQDNWNLNVIVRRRQF